MAETPGASVLVIRRPAWGGRDTAVEIGLSFSRTVWNKLAVDAGMDTAFTLYAPFRKRFVMGLSIPSVSSIPAGVGTCSTRENFQQTACASL